MIVSCFEGLKVNVYQMGISSWYFWAIISYTPSLFWFSLFLLLLYCHNLDLPLSLDTTLFFQGFPLSFGFWVVFYMDLEFGLRLVTSWLSKMTTFKWWSYQFLPPWVEWVTAWYETLSTFTLNIYPRWTYAVMHCLYEWKTEKTDLFTLSIFQRSSKQTCSDKTYQSASTASEGYRKHILG